MIPKRCDKRPRDEAVEEVNEPPEFMIANKTPPLLLAWWNDMGHYLQTSIFKHLAFLTDIMRISPDRDLIAALIPFWDSANNVFRFRDFELTPTLEELGGFTGLGKNLRNKTPLAPRNVSGNNVLEQIHLNHPRMLCLDNGWVTLEFLYARYGNKQGFLQYGKQLKNGNHYFTWEKHRQEEFMVAFLGTMVFPRRDRKIDIRLSGIVTAMMKREDSTILPMILADIYHALTECREGEKYFEGCNTLLQVWFLEHLYRHHYQSKFKSDWKSNILDHLDRVEELRKNLPEGVKAWAEYLRELTASQITWNYHWFPSAEVICMSFYRPFFVLMGLRGFQPYAPLRVLRQLGRRQIVPIVENMQNFVWEVKSEDRRRELEAKRIWGGHRVLGLSTMIEDRDQGEVDLLYFHWFHDQAPLKVRPEGSVKEARDKEAEVEVRIKQARFEVEENYQSTLHAIDKELKTAREDLAQMEVEMGARARAAQKTAERKHRSTIQTLYEDLGIVREVVDVLQRELDKKGDFFDAEKARFEDEKAQFLALQTRQQAEFDKERVQFDVERNQLMNDRERIRNQLELALHREVGIREIANTRQQQVQDPERNYRDVREHVHNLAVHVAQSCLDCQGMGYEQFAREVPTFARHFTAELKQIYRMLGGQPGPEAP
ncbi:uncharacterized protein LOC132622799 [Lycium barbarum]|uniref:uncharacterized protein LOC132622799 n=1 Tax=Lycium barbarum TaxID=112863 RepID=UPI00293E5EA1|nr:uncharacterized protein LOC132622799 [Lycium barbarum]